MNENISKHAAAELLLLLMFFLSSCKGGAGGGSTTGNKEPGAPPDLVISALSADMPSVAPGKTFTVSSTVTNKGNGPSDYFVVGFHLSTDAIYGNHDDIPFTALRLVKSLAAGENSTDSTTLTVPSSTPPGSYVLCAKADDKNRIVESDKTNNTRCLYTLALQIDNIRGPSAPPPNGFGYFVKKFSDNLVNFSSPRQDGIPDIIVSQPEEKGGGVVYVYSGKTGYLIYQIKGTGWSYPVDAGDLNRDGVSDLLVGDSASGVAQAYSGLDGVPLSGLTFNSDGVNDGFGISVAAIGDITGDGIPDLIVGAPGGNYVVLYSGADGSRIKRIDSPDGNGNFGMSVSAAGDINGDGIPDFIVGAPGASPGGMDGAGSAFVYSGQADANGDFPVLYRLDGEHKGDGFGGCCGAIDTVGDLNGDGKMELAIAAYAASPNAMASAGSIYLFDGATGLPLQRPDGLGPMRFDGEAPGDRLGGSLSGSGWISNMGDLNGDGYPDFMAGASGADIGSQSNAGRVLIFSGYDGSVLSRIDNPFPDGIHYFGVSGANFGDLLGDGHIEILIGAGEIGDGKPGIAYLISLNVISMFNVTYPDLVMVNVTPNDSSVNAGGTLSVTDSVKNQGPVPSNAFKIGYHLSKDSTYGGADDVVIPTTRSVSSLGAGASNTSTTSLMIPSTTPAGTYHICAMADSDTTVIETNENNNTLCSGTTLTVPLPDLAVTALSTAATTVGQGGSFSLSNTVENQGGASAGGFTVAFHLSTNTTYGDGDDIAFTATRTVSSLAAGATDTANTTLTIPNTTPPGSYYVCAKADNGNAVPEGNESNNSLCTASTITVLDPDLIETAVTPNASTVSGGTLSVTDTVKNQGSAPAGSFKVGYDLSPTASYSDPNAIAITTTRTVNSLAAGATDTATTTLTIPSTSPGNYYVCAKADSANAVTELDETNNSLCTSTTIQVAPPDLIMTAVTPNASTVSGTGTLSVTDSVKNQGIVSTGSFKVGYDLSPTASYSDPGAIAITTTRTVSSLAAGATNTATTTLTIPNTTPTGSYYICAMADSANAVTELDETNNTLCSATTVNVPQSDLIVSAVSTTATVLAPGSTLTLSNMVKNQGAFPAGSFTVAFHLSVNTTYGDGDDVAFSTTRTISSLVAGVTDTTTTALTIPAATPVGTYYVCAMADSGNTVAESDETNNSLCTGTKIQVRLPDLIGTAVTPNASTVTQGATLSVTDTAQNQGPVSTGVGFRVGFHLSVNTTYGDGDDVAISTTRVVSVLDAGASSTGTTSLSIPSSMPPGTYHVCAMADSLLQVTESDETNNTLCSSTTITVTP